jgi:hypothetical protein
MLCSGDESDQHRVASDSAVKLVDQSLTLAIRNQCCHVAKRNRSKPLDVVRGASVSDFR